MGRTLVLSSKYKLTKLIFTDWMSFLPSNLIEEINPNSEAFSTNTVDIAGKKTKYFGTNALI